MYNKFSCLFILYIMTSRAWFLRHGDALYEEGKVNCNKTKYYNWWTDKTWKLKPSELEDFFVFASQHKDLDAEKTQKIWETIQALIETWSLEEKEIIFMISPFARVLHTTMLAIQSLVNQGYDINKIMIVDQLRECENFEWQYLKACVFGWECEIDGRVVTIDKNITNPENKSTSDYFYDEWLHTIPKEYLKSIWAYDRISSIEKYEEVETRSQRDIFRILNKVDKDQFLFIVGHQVFTDRMVKAQEDYGVGWQKPAEILLLDDSWTYERISWETSER